MPTNSLISKSPSTFDGASRPKLVRDPMIRPGGGFLFDFTDPRCHPGGVITPGNLPAGTVFKSLDATPVTATVVNGAGMTVNADGSIEFNGAGSSNYLKIGATGQFDMAPAEYEFLTTLWLKIPATGYTTSNYWSPYTNGGGGTATAQVWFDMGTGGLAPRVGTGSGTAGFTTSEMSIAPGAVQQVAMRFDPATRLEGYTNGALRSAVTTGVYTDLADCSTRDLRIQNAGKFTCYRVSLTNMDAAIAQETVWKNAALIEEADVLTVAQHVAADNAFGRGTLTGAPRTAIG